MISATQAAELLNVSPTRIRVLCNLGRIPGAQNVSGVWIIPDKPVVLAGKRIRPGKIQLKNSRRK